MAEDKINQHHDENIHAYEQVKIKADDFKPCQPSNPNYTYMKKSVTSQSSKQNRAAKAQ